MKRLILVLLTISVLLGTVGVALASDISDAIYYGVIRATNSSTLAENVSANVSINTTSLIASGIINSTANNTAIRKSGGTDAPFMPGYGDNPWAVWFDSVPENASVDVTLYTNSTNGSIRYFPSDAGMATPDNNATFEIGDNFTIESSGFLDTDAGTSKNFAYKKDAVKFGVTDDEEVAVAIAFDSSDLMGHWHADENTGTGIADDSGNGNTGTLTNVTWGEDSTSPYLIFNGTTSKGNCGSDATLKPALITVSAWIYSTNISGNKWIAEFDCTDSDTKGRGYSLYIGSGKVTFMKGSGDMSFEFVTGNTTLSASTWYYVTGQYIGGTSNCLKVYVNGVTDNISSCDTADISYTNPDAFHIGYSSSGSQPDSGFFQGYIDEVAVWDIVLTANQLLDCHSAGRKESLLPVVTCMATGVDKGEGTIATQHTGTVLKILVDGAETANTSTTASVPNNSNSWTFLQNGVMPYMEYQEVTINGTQRQYIEWEYGATFTDQSGNGNNATPTFLDACSDPDVSASLISFTPVELAEADEDVAEEWPEMMESPPDEPTTAYTEEEHPGIFFEPLVDTVCDLLDIPESFFWYNFAFFVIIGAGMLTFWGFAKNNTQALLIKIIVMAALMALFALPGPNIYGFYVVIYFGFFSFGVLVLSRSYGW